MAESFLGPHSMNLVPAGTVISVTGNSSVITLDLADSYAFVVKTSAFTGTSPTLDLAIQVTPDNGTTWFDWFRFAQITGVVTRRLVVQPIQGRGEAGTEAAITAAASGALNANVPFPGALNQIRFAYTLGGTSPVPTLGIWVFMQTKQSAI